MVAVLALSAIATAAPIFSENFDSMTVGQVPAGWTGVGATPAIVSQDKAASGSNSVKTPGTTVNSTAAADYNIVGMTTKNWEATWKFNSTATSTRDFIQLRSYSGGGSSGSLQQLISFGNYNTGGANKYMFRIAVGASPALPLATWGNTSITRVNDVWKEMKVTHTDLGNGTANVKFYVDGVEGASWNTTAVFPLTQIRIGSALSNNNSASYFDDIVVTPEPATLALLASGLFLVRRRRA